MANLGEGCAEAQRDGPPIPSSDTPPTATPAIAEDGAGAGTTSPSGTRPPNDSIPLFEIRLDAQTSASSSGDTSSAPEARPAYDTSRAHEPPPDHAAAPRGAAAVGGAAMPGHAATPGGAAMPGHEVSARMPPVPTRPAPDGQRPMGLGDSAQRKHQSPAATAVLGTLGGLLLIAAIGAVAMHIDRARVVARERSAAGAGSAATYAGAPSASAGATAGTALGTPSAVPGESGSASSSTPASRSSEGAFRVASLAHDPSVRLVEGTLGRRSFLEAASLAGLPRSEAFRTVLAMRAVHDLDRPHRHDSFTAALDRASRKLRAFEYVVSPTEIYQLRERPDGSLGAERVDMHIEQTRRSVVAVIGDDLSTSLAAAGLRASFVDLLDEALAGRVALAALRPGARLRMLVTEETSFGAFSRYVHIDALDYLAAGDDADSTALRLYYFAGKKEEGYFDAKGKSPFRGGWRAPIPGARISSQFNPRRMHPILHVIKPHNGVDFAASAGTPVYAAYRGTVLAVGPSGPSGNLVLLDHGNGITTGYAHLSRFAPGLHAGQSVETRQLIGYVGTTGRSTGPHLHFSARKHGRFMDPLRLRLDGQRTLPKSERPAFDALRSELDRELDAIAWPNVEAAREHGPPNEGEPQDEIDPAEEASAAPPGPPPRN